MNTHMMPLDSIRIDGDTHNRVAINTDVVAEYAELVDKLPPVTIHYDGTNYWLTDGFHRYHAARKAGAKMIRVEVRQGSLDDARWFAASANRTHGLRRSNADKQKAVAAALRLRPNHSDRVIAEHVGVSHSMVGTIRSELASIGTLPSSANRISRDGHVINTANIGKGRRLNARSCDATAQRAISSSSPGSVSNREPRTSEAPAVRSPGGLDRHPTIKAILLRMDMLVNMPLSRMSQEALIEAVRNLKDALVRAP